MRILSGRLALVGLLTIALLGVACGSTEEAKEERDRAQQALATREGGVKPPAAATAAGGTPAATAPAGGGATAGPAPAGSVAVTLTEFAIAAEPAQKPGGSVVFATKNGGAILHELVVIKSDAAPDKLEQKSGVVDESKVTVAGRTEQFPGGESRNLTTNLQPGKYILICNIVGHYQLGMRTAFTVQ